MGLIIFANAYGIILGLVLGICIALSLTIYFIKKSNDIGDSKGGFYDFGDYIHEIDHMDNLSTMSTSRPVNFLNNLFK